MKLGLKNILGFILCLTSSLLICCIFFQVKGLIIIPIIVFIISIFIKNRIVSLILNLVIPCFFIILFLSMLIPTNKTVIVDSRIRYQLIDFGQGDIIRNSIEYRLNNRRIFLADTTNGIRWFYVDYKDFKRLWPEPPFDMREKNYTIKARFEAKKLMFGDYSKATIIQIEKLNENPMITK